MALQIVVDSYCGSCQGDCGSWPNVSSSCTVHEKAKIEKVVVGDHELLICRGDQHSHAWVRLIPDVPWVETPIQELRPGSYFWKEWQGELLWLGVA